MYEAFFGLSAKPFQLSPDPRFFFRSTGHKRALAYMRYGLQQGQGFIIVTGDVGTGKTMLVNNLFRELPKEMFAAAQIVSSNVKDVDLLRMIAAEFQIPFEKQSKAALISSLVAYFRECRRDGKRVLLVIDEAQNLPRSALEELRMLSNFEEDGIPLVQSFLLGQREFRGMLRAPGLEQVRQRVIAAYHLKPLSAPEIRSYIEFRLRTVGWNGNPPIDEQVFVRVHEATDGVPRRINTLFDRVLLHSFLDEADAITVNTVDSAVEEIEIEQGVDDNDLPTRETAAPHAGEPGRQLRVNTAEAPTVDARLADMQRTINQLAERIAPLTDANHARGVSTVPADASELEPRQFGIWTVACIGLILGGVVVAAALGMWLLSR